MILVIHLLVIMEKQLSNERMRDCGGFEGNAQTLRILSLLEKKEMRDFETGGYAPIISTGLDLRVRAKLNISIFGFCIKVRQSDPGYRRELNIGRGTKGILRRGQEACPPDQEECRRRCRN